MKHVFGYFPSNPQICIIYLTLMVEMNNFYFYFFILISNSIMVEVNSLKRKWIMGVCDLNYWLVCVEICLIYHICLNSQLNVSFFQLPCKPHTEYRLDHVSYRAWTGSVKSSRIIDASRSKLCFIYFTKKKIR